MCNLRKPSTVSSRGRNVQIISLIYALKTPETPQSNQQIAVKFAERVSAPEGTKCPDFIVPVVLAVALAAGQTT